MTSVQQAHYLHFWKQVRAGDETKGVETEVSTELVHTPAKKTRAQQLPLGSCAAGTVVRLAQSVPLKREFGHCYTTHNPEATVHGGNDGYNVAD